MSKLFNGKVALVTGAGRGVGRAIAEAFASADASVMVATRTRQYGEETVAAIGRAGGKAALFQVDVTDKDGISALVGATIAQFGALDIVVHSAADIPHGAIRTITDEQIEKGIASIVKAAFWLSREALPHLAKARDGGRLIFISSVAGNKTHIPGLVAYGVAKAGLTAFIKGAALEFAPENVTVNGIEPGLVASDNMKRVLNEQQIAFMSSRIPVPRPCSVDEVAHAALFLASPMSAYITGASLTMDGGSTISTSEISFTGGPASPELRRRKQS